jgi:hypothetical protein
MDRYSADRDISPAFVAQVIGWIRASSEVFVLLRYLRAGGRKDVAFCRSAEAFQRIIDAAPIGTDIIVFQERQLPFRGTADEAFVISALAAIRDGEEYALATLGTAEGSDLSAAWSMGDTHADLLAELDGLRGQDVACGPCPDFNAPDGPTIISAAKGGVDGPR